MTKSIKNNRLPNAFEIMFDTEGAEVGRTSFWRIESLKLRVHKKI
jgi:hypothetical protein